MSGGEDFLLEESKEPDWDQCTVCVHYDRECRPPIPGDNGSTECDAREIDPVRWKDITGEKWEPWQRKHIGLVEVIPEPAGLLAVGGGLAGLISIIRKKGGDTNVVE